MGELPTINLLESTNAIPEVYVLKVIGRRAGAFAERVVAAARGARVGRRPAVPGAPGGGGKGRHVAEAAAWPAAEGNVTEAPDMTDR